MVYSAAAMIARTHDRSATRGAPRRAARRCGDRSRQRVANPQP
ncbi:hypothetical protein BURMUCF2_2988 [Burkholderia multivorans CF2]|nr:hypothetical protein BURMUCF2_2988 [Burkholderia multivorans CF2]